METEWFSNYDSNTDILSYPDETLIKHLFIISNLIKVSKHSFKNLI